MAGDDAGGMSIISKAERVLAIMADAGPVTASALAQQLSEPVSSVYRIIRNMESVGWLEKAAERGRYRLGAMLIRIGQMVEDSLDVRRLSLPRLQALHDATEESAYLCVRNDHRAVCIERIDGAQVQSREFPVGGSMALHRGAASLAILAFEREAFRDEYLDSLMVATVNPFVPSDRVRIEADLAAIERNRVAISDGDITPGVITIAAPILDHRGVVVASIALSALRARLEAPLDELEILVRAEAQQVTHALGGPEEDA